MASTTLAPHLKAASPLDCLVAAGRSASPVPSSFNNTSSHTPSAFTAPIASITSINHISPSTRLHTRPVATAESERGLSNTDERQKERVPNLHHDIYRYSSPDIEPDTLGHAPGTAENPLIPKRRRRTSPAELAILEIEFARNPLPSQGERSRIADRVGMTGRAAQVWFQNRRQKGKKDAHTYHGGSDVGSSNGSAPDPDQDVSDLDAFTYSSSPAPAPSPPLTLGSSVPSHSLDTPSTTSAPSNNASIPTHPLGSFSFLSSSEELYAGTAGNKENDARLPFFPAPSLVPIVDELKPDVLKEPEPTTSAPDQPPPIFVHRLATTSIITAKKHVTKRPLGSHAPLARQTSLSHNFDFPPSPVKGSKEDVAQPRLRRQASATSVASTGSGAGGKVGGLFSLTTNESGRARVWVDALNNEWDADAKAGADDEQVDVNAMEVDPSKPSRTTLSALSNDEVWQHMASDPPSSFSPTSSPVPLTRKMMLALAAQDSRPVPSTRTRPGTAFALSMSNLPSTAAARRPPLVRSDSLGGGTGSRAGGEETCAEMALGRKRARMGDDASSSGSSSSRRRSAGTASKGGARRRNASGLTVSTTLASSSSSASEVGDSSLEMGELSFSSTSTAFSAELGTPGSGKKTFFGRKSEVVVGNDEERECAELLLGLGGSFF